jgi:hypothetical protein
VHPLERIKRLLSDRSAPSGKVIGTDGNYVTLATSQGSKRVMKASGDATSYRVGDEVVLANGQIVGRRIRQPTVYVV